MATDTSSIELAGSRFGSSPASLLPLVVALGLIVGLVGSITISRLELVDSLTTGAITGFVTGLIYLGLLIAISR